MERNALRREKIRARDSLTAAERMEMSENISRRILASEEYGRAETLLIYKGVRGEVRLDVLERAAAADGKRLAYPLCVGPGEMIALIPQDEGSWSKGAYGILEPVRETSREIAPRDIDLVICPCTVFDAACGRMGMGAGYYDRYLPGCGRAVIAAAAFEVQKAERVPMEPWDRAMDMVFTEKRVYQGRQSLCRLEKPADNK